MSIYSNESESKKQRRQSHHSDDVFLKLELSD